MEFDYSQFGLSTEELFSHVDNNDLESEKITAPRYSYWKSVFRVFFRNKFNIVILTLLAFVILMSYLYPAFTDYDRFGSLLDMEAKHLTPAAAIEKFGFQIKYILGTGGAGESTFDAIWYGAQISLSLAFICAAINMTIGVVLGALWGFSKKVDSVMIVIYNIVANVPYILLLSVLVMLFRATFWTMVFAMTLTGWLGIAYSLRVQVIIIRDREYNLASRCLGTSTVKIAMKNILPFMTSIIVTMLAAEVPGYISYEVFLSFLGLGMNDITLGKLIYLAQNAMVTPGWGWEFWCPVFVASIITIVLYLVGQNLGDASDPRTHM